MSLEEKGAARTTTSWWAAVAAVAATYTYFLLFAEFALLELVEPFTGEDGLRQVMGLLGAGGVIGSLYAAWRYTRRRLAMNLASAFVAAAASAAALLLAQNTREVVLIVPVVGLSLGALTVTLAAGLHVAISGGRLGLAIGLGTGCAYAVCNAPAVFGATPHVQTCIAAVTAGTGAITAWWFRCAGTDAALFTPTSQSPGYTAAALVPWIAVFLVLVWLDSAAFYVIQHTDELRAGSWTTPGQLALNAAVHLGAAVVAGWALDRGNLRVVVGGGCFALVVATAALGLAGVTSLGVPALYTAGVSLYSTALVYVPARSGRAWQAALVYAIAGWAGSALGIGMAQDLHRVPVMFLVGAMVIVAIVVFRPRRKASVGTGVMGFLLAGGLFPETAHAGDVAARLTREHALVARGRDVYIAEGCIHCHSQFVRRGTTDVDRWGPARPLEDVLATRPPLLGNRRQGPDLAEVGNRRSAEWNRLHLIAPRSITPGSRMPSYRHLFTTSDGDALVAYLASLGGSDAPRADVADWRPSGEPSSPERVSRLFTRWCASCHGETGRADGPLVAQLSLPPPDFSRDPWRRVAPGPDEELVLARIIKFGLPGSPMAGHEFLADEDVTALARHVRNLHARGRP